MQEREKVSGELIKLDYATLSDTEYRGCKLVYEGGRPPSLQNIDFIECEFIFDGSAMNTLHFLFMLAHSGDTDLVVKKMLGLSNWGPQDAE